jgi:pyruvate formate lyase activating enzyme
MKISGLQKLTLLDFPGRTACTVFTAGCNFRCPFCYNAPLVTKAAEQPSIDMDYLFAFLKNRRGLLDGVAVTGGEPTLQPDLEDFIIKVRELGYQIKLDTNGTHPDVLRRLIGGGLIDYAAMDIKASPDNYAGVTGVPGLDLGPVRESVSLLMEGKIDFEFRTTAVKTLHTVEEFADIGRWIEGAPRYFIQSYKDEGDIICPGLEAFSRAELDRIADTVRPFVPAVSLRGVD